MASRPTLFTDSERRFRADTCEPLRTAAAQEAVILHALARGTYPGERLPPSWLPGLRTVGYWDAQRPQGWGLDWHRNEGIELTYVSAGRVAFEAGDYRGVLRPGDLTITRPWQRHRVGDPNVDVCALHWLILDVGVRRPNQDWRWPRWILAERAELDWLETVLRENDKPVWRSDAETRRCFERLSHLVEHRRKATRGRLAALVNELLLALGDLLARRAPVLDTGLSSSERAVHLFLEALPETVEERWTLNSMAAACGIGRTAFARYCHRQTNLTPKQYLTQCRLQAAARLLADQPGLSITEIAASCGYLTSQHFASAFHRWSGLPPREYRIATIGAQGPTVLGWSEPLQRA